MTEDILNAAIQKLRGMALEQYALIKDLYHQPATTETVNNISSYAVNLAQLEGAMITLQQYAKPLAELTPAEKSVAPEPEPEEPAELPPPLSRKSKAIKPKASKKGGDK